MLEGELTGVDGSELRSALTSLAARRPKRLIVDLRRATFIDAGVVAILRALSRRIASAGGHLLVLASAQVERTLTAVGAAELLA